MSTDVQSAAKLMAENKRLKEALSQIAAYAGQKGHPDSRLQVATVAGMAGAALGLEEE